MADDKSAPITSRPPLADLTGARGTPPGIAYIGRDDRLYVSSNSLIGGQNIRISGRLLGADGLIRPFVFVHANSSSGVTVTEAFQLAEGFLLSVAAIPANNDPVRGQVFAEVGILRGRTADLQIVQVLFAGYLTEDHAIGFPGGRQMGTTEGPGRTFLQPSADPAAGAEVSLATPLDVRRRPLTARVTLVTDATAANRLPRLELAEGATVIWRSHPHDAQIASETRTYNWALGGVFAAAVAAGEHQNVLPEVMLSGMAIRTSTDALQAGDNYGIMQVLVEDWIED